MYLIIKVLMGLSFVIIAKLPSGSLTTTNALTWLYHDGLVKKRREKMFSKRRSKLTLSPMVKSSKWKIWHHRNASDEIASPTEKTMISTKEQDSEASNAHPETDNKENNLMQAVNGLITEIARELSDNKDNNTAIDEHPKTDKDSTPPDNKLPKEDNQNPEKEKSETSPAGKDKEKDKDKDTNANRELKPTPDSDQEEEEGETFTVKYITHLTSDTGPVEKDFMLGDSGSSEQNKGRTSSSSNDTDQEYEKFDDLVNLCSGKIAYDSVPSVEANSLKLKPDNLLPTLVGQKEEIVSPDEFEKLETGDVKSKNLVEELKSQQEGTKLFTDAEAKLIETEKPLLNIQQEADLFDLKNFNNAENFEKFFPEKSDSKNNEDLSKEKNTIQQSSDVQSPLVNFLEENVGFVVDKENKLQSSLFDELEHASQIIGTTEEKFQNKISDNSEVDEFLFPASEVSNVNREVRVEEQKKHHLEKHDQQDDSTCSQPTLHRLDKMMLSDDENKGKVYQPVLDQHARPWLSRNYVDPAVYDLLRWKNPKVTGVTVALIVMAFIFVSQTSMVALLAYCGLAGFAILLGMEGLKAVSNRIGRPVASVNLTNNLFDGQKLPRERIHAQVDVALEELTKALIWIRSAILVERKNASLMLFVMLFVLTYIGHWFSAFGMLCISVVLAFSLPYILHNYNSEISAYGSLAKTQVEQIVRTVDEKLPFLGLSKKS
ncbi:Reticulon-3 [Trichinella zimbabwensis]|uniref:Reticulon-like protein n=1 Tax=Trichinella zimbabwensis TaxID=268475 RepID=A0A0V1HQK0_9BILA|nr:Reticulon-3 [Trichinella zimbabwensis]